MRNSPSQKNRESRQAALEHSTQQSPADRIAYTHNNALTHDSSLHAHSSITHNQRTGPTEVLDQPHEAPVETQSQGGDLTPRAHGENHSQRDSERCEQPAMRRALQRSLSFADTLTGDPFQHSYHMKKQVRDANVNRVFQQKMDLETTPRRARRLECVSENRQGLPLDNRPFDQVRNIHKAFQSTIRSQIKVKEEEKKAQASETHEENQHLKTAYQTMARRIQEAEKLKKQQLKAELDHHKKGEMAIKNDREGRRISQQGLDYQAVEHEKTNYRRDTLAQHRSRSREQQAMSDFLLRQIQQKRQSQ